MFLLLFRPAAAKKLADEGITTLEGNDDISMLGYS